MFVPFILFVNDKYIYGKLNYLLNASNVIFTLYLHMEEIKFEQSLGHLLHMVSMKMRRILEKRIKSFDITAHQFGTLLLISKKGSMTQKMISAMTVDDEALTSRLVVRLMEKKLVQRQKNPDDKRQQLVSLTSKGEEVLKQLTPIAMQINGEIKSLLNEDEFQSLLKTLNKINSGLE
jgi:DNA-binding MarR family transcriptional regulator